MNKPANIIQINGRRYDSQTGQLVQTGQSGGVAASVDEVVGHKPSKATVLLAPKLQATKPIKPLSASKLMDMKAPKRRLHAVAKAAVVHSPQTSHTLMRHVVKKPGKSLILRHPAHGHTSNLVAKASLAVVSKKSVAVVPPERLARAKQIPKSTKISRFALHGATVLQSPFSAVNDDVSMVSATTAKPLDIFEQALQRATSHQQPAVVPQKHKYSKRRTFLSSRAVSLSAATLSVLLLASFIGFENRTNLTLRMAASKAGFSASLPGYKPAGFSVGRVNYSPGSVAINFHSNSDRRAFAISEKPSAWDSTTLRDNFVTQADQQYQTVSVGGRTVYMYGHNNAAWVNGGMLYQVTSDGSLSNRQLSDLAASL